MDSFHGKNYCMHLPWLIGLPRENNLAPATRRRRELLALFSMVGEPVNGLG
jgi:hypothetical protein